MSIGYVTAGQDATDAFFGLHRHEVLLRPQYARLQVGSIEGEEETIKAPVPGELSTVPYAEPTWLSEGYYSPFYTQNHRDFQKAIRKLFMEIIEPESAKREGDGKRISPEVVQKLRCVASCPDLPVFADVQEARRTSCLCVSALGST